MVRIVRVLFFLLLLLLFGRNGVDALLSYVGSKCVGTKSASECRGEMRWLGWWCWLKCGCHAVISRQGVVDGGRQVIAVVVVVVRGERPCSLFP